MNKIIQAQLKKCEVADLSTYDEATCTYHIPRFRQVKLEVNTCYLIKLDDMVLNRDSSSVLVSNWNKGTVPPCRYMKVDVCKVLGKMIQVNGLGFDYDTKEDLNVMWSGWLPLQNISVIERI